MCLRIRDGRLDQARDRFFQERDIHVFAVANGECLDSEIGFKRLM
ncbi:MAG: hypothetical protein P8N94_07290 [Gammaproteobacteria bacterium]|nr:hypothetical protein [Gammaproteobacteria bacterium]MDG2337778.1 hypothetical protein [Gammaproteobacteria bacterium]